MDRSIAPSCLSTLLTHHLHISLLSILLQSLSPRDSVDPSAPARTLSSLNKHVEKRKIPPQHTTKLLPLRKEATLCRPQNRPSSHRHDINHVSHRTHIICHHDIKRSVLELACLLSIAHHVSLSRVFANFALRADHVVHVVRPVQNQTAHVHRVVQRLDLADADGRRPAGTRAVGCALVREDNSKTGNIGVQIPRVFALI